MAFRPLFRRYDDFTVVKPIRLSSNKVLEPGTHISKQDYRTHRLMNWFRRRCIGKKDCEWVKQQLAVWNAKVARYNENKAAAKTTIVASAEDETDDVNADIDTENDNSNEVEAAEPLPSLKPWETGANNA